MIIICFVISFILVLIALFVLYVKQEKGNKGSAFLMLMIAILSAVLGVFVSDGYAYAVKNIPVISELLHEHQVVSSKKENVKNSTCLDTGSYDFVEFCERGEELSRKTVIAPALGHEYIEKEISPTCTEKGYISFTCIRCDDYFEDNYFEALGHDFQDGVCTRCGEEDLEGNDCSYVYDSEDIMQLLDDSIIIDSGTYTSYLGAESIHALGIERTNCFSIYTLGASGNEYCEEFIVFDISSFNNIRNLKFKIGAKADCGGPVLVDIFLDKEFNKYADESKQFEPNEQTTSFVSLPGFESAETLGIRVINKSDSPVNVVFYDFEGQTE